jgi:glycosyltransferase involved in cell wall biosynthesis
MPRLAWFTPLPPVRSGVAAYSAELLPLLAPAHHIDAFVDPAAPAPTADPGVPLYPSHEFLWRHRTDQYDLVVYQLGNATCHDYMWPYLSRFPGLVVLHDAQLHHARSRALFAAGRQDHYRQEFAFCHRDANQGVAELVISGQAGSLYYLWPLIGVPVACARLVAVHSQWLAARLTEEYPGQEFAVVRMGVGEVSALEGPQGVLDVRSRHRIPADRVVFGAYGMVTPEKRISQILKALPIVLPSAPSAHVMLVGEPVDWYDVEAEARAVGVADHVTVTGYVPDEELSAYLAAADACLCLRWPTSRETSAAWLRCLAAGKPTVITDLLQTCSTPALDPRDWTVLDGTAPGDEDRLFPPDRDSADEQHSLALAMRRLARDEGLRRELGERAREYWRRRHTPRHMAEDYRLAIDRALSRPAPDRSGLPPHLLDEGIGLTGNIVGDFGLSLETLDWGVDSRVVDR